MKEKMKAVVCYDVGDYRLERVPIPSIGPFEVLIRVQAAGICASDVKTYLGAARIWGSEEFPRYIETPVIPGHEFVGEVVQLGEGSAHKHKVAIGDMVVSEQIVPCWQCRFCKRGQYWMCETHNIYGFKGGVADGAWAEFMKFPSGAIVHKVPKEIPPEHAVLVEPLACAIHAVERANIQLGDVVVIAGMGPIGLCMLQVAQLKSPGLLIALDLIQKRLETARELGADIVINVEEEDPIAVVHDMTSGYGCDVYIEATGSPKGVYQGLQMIRKLGTFVEFSVMTEPATVDWSIIGDQKELDIHGAHLGPYCYPRAIDYIAKGIVSAHKIVTHKMPLDDYRKALELAHSREESIKIVLIP